MAKVMPEVSEDGATASCLRAVFPNTCLSVGKIIILWTTPVPPSTVATSHVWLSHTGNKPSVMRN